ncbi:2-oxoacid:acceptor oxidoreductase family protein [Candidatus Xianfuyuplasma coldseepsis]|uniref:2-oxoacid:ferredoxin oxidoreductase subunit gamma n=1 Tax=Candidatus Xianfuyuplasma coldseepsis TaxID=2782163 RepID=A0A7L7KNJ8_9MOLU|nr:2-oxoacid:acceptor oxidoreductase family protein [Xianfuyuplasma coldseepsis]QMS84311.1 2-oxoacid:ferredoxin oxidoreductase subunit gamma [Xianfuyuplasma coldseepsis]
MINEKVIIAGFGGQGVMLMGQILSYCATEKDVNTLWFPSYGPETRGGTANCSVTISEEYVNSPVISTPDSIIIMNKPSLAKFQPKLKQGGLCFVNSSLVIDEAYRDDVTIYQVPANDLALQLGNLKVANMVMLGAYLAITKIFTFDDVISVLEHKFTGTKAKLIDINRQALEVGKNAVIQ